MKDPIQQLLGMTIGTIGGPNFVYKLLNPNQTGGGPNGPPGLKSLIFREPKVGLTLNQAVNLSLSVV